MKLQRFSLIILTSVILGLSFSSCDAWDYYWTPGKLDNTITSTVSSSGVIRTDFRVTIDQIYTDNRRVDIRDLSFKGGFMSISTDFQGDRINWMRLTLDGTNISVDLSGEVGEYNSFQVQNFMNEVTQMVRDYGFAIILVDGQARSGTRFNLGMFMDLDVYVRE